MRRFRRRWLKTLENRRDVWVADTHARLAGQIQARRGDDPNFSLSGDGVHPGFWGHTLMARSVLDRMGVATNDSNIENDVKEIREDPLFQLVDHRSRLLGDAWRKRAGFSLNNKQTRVDNIDEPLKRAEALQQRIDDVRSR